MILAFSSKECHDEMAMAWRRQRVVVLRGQAFTFGGSSWVEEWGLGLMGGSQWILSILLWVLFLANGFLTKFDGM